MKRGKLRKIRVMVVDDSALMRKLIPMILGKDERFEIVGTAGDGEIALMKIPKVQPDVITLDVDMPRMDGITALRAIVRDYGIPVILVSSLTKKGALTTLKGLELGAFDFIQKPKGPSSVHIQEISSDLIGKVWAASIAGGVRYKEPSLLKVKARSDVLDNSAESIVVIGVSTGGPQALSELLPLFPTDFPAGILIVQHMPADFIGIFAARLNSISNIKVKEASDGDHVTAGKALIAPGGRHMKVKKTPFGAVTLLDGTHPVSGHCPSADVLFKSVAKEYGGRATGILMTGMGSDGVEGMKELRESGGRTIAQNEETSVIFGMPKLAIEKGYVDLVLGLDEILPALVNLFSAATRESRENFLYQKGGIRI